MLNKIISLEEYIARRSPGNDDDNDELNAELNLYRSMHAYIECTPELPEKLQYVQTQGTGLRIMPIFSEKIIFELKKQNQDYDAENLIRTMMLFDKFESKGFAITYLQRTKAITEHCRDTLLTKYEKKLKNTGRQPDHQSGVPPDNGLCQSYSYQEARFHLSMLSCTNNRAAHKLQQLERPAASNVVQFNSNGISNGIPDTGLISKNIDRINEWYNKPYEYFRKAFEKAEDETMKDIARIEKLKRMKNISGKNF